MIIKPFDSPRPADGPGRTGWEAEKQMAFLLARAFEHDPGVFVFNDLRLATGSGVIEADHVQLDHLVLHRHGMAVIESKATGDDRGEFHVDELGQWQRRPSGPRSGYNMPSPLLQAERQRDALGLLLEAVRPPLLGKRLGLIQAHFRDVPMSVFVAIANNARVTGHARVITDRVMKAEQIVAAIKTDIAKLRDGDGGVWFRDVTMQRIVDYLLANHRPPHQLDTPAAPGPAPAARPTQQAVGPAALKPVPAVPAANAPAAPRPVGRADEPEALTCRHCRSINVGVVYRKDYCLLCQECGKYTPLDWACRGCGKPATIRKRGPEFFRACDKAGGCGREVVFWRGEGG